MSINPSYDPYNAGGRPNQNDIDQQYLQQLAGQPRIYNAPQPAAPMYSQPVTEINRTITNTPVQVNTPVMSAPRDRVRWGPIMAGLVSALATLLVLSLLGVAVGLTAAAGDPNGGANAAAAKANNYSTGASIWAALSALIAFFIGGFVAARTAGVRGKTNGWINGALVWAIALPLLLWLASSGASGFLNAIGFNLNGFVNNVNGAVNSVTNNTANPGTVQASTEAARNGAWGTLGALVLGLLASALGGLIGARAHENPQYRNDNNTNVPQNQGYIR